MDNLHDWLTLCLTPGLGPLSCKRLSDHFGGPGFALRAAEQELDQVPGIRRQARQALRQGLGRPAAEEQLERAQRLGITIVSWDDPEYPQRLRTIYGPPLILFRIGEGQPLQEEGVAVVGTRAATSYGRRVATMLGAGLAGRGLNLISGLALGIDAAAHEGALQAGGLTTAVLGCGLDVIYPAQNAKLFEKIASRGIILSEYPLGTRPDGFRFPARNRIISGLALGVVVVEGSLRSGALITAQLALEQGREVFAIPGQVDSWKSEGCHRLIQQGAKLVRTVDDIIVEFPGWCGRTSSPEECPASVIRLSAEERSLLELLEVYPQAMAAILQSSGLPVAKLSELLLLLELKGFIELLPGQHYQVKGSQ